MLWLNGTQAQTKETFCSCSSSSTFESNCLWSTYRFQGAQSTKGNSPQHLNTALHSKSTLGASISAQSRGQTRPLPPHLCRDLHQDIGRLNKMPWLALDEMKKSGSYNHQYQPSLSFIENWFLTTRYIDADMHETSLSVHHHLQLELCLIPLIG